MERRLVIKIEERDIIQHDANHLVDFKLLVYFDEKLYGSRASEIQVSRLLKLDTVALMLEKVILNRVVDCRVKIFLGEVGTPNLEVFKASLRDYLV